TFAPVILRVDVNDSKKVHLHNGFPGGPAIVAHPRRRVGKAPRMQCHPFLHVELVAHADREFARNHRDGFSHRMITRGTPVAKDAKTSTTALDFRKSGRSSGLLKLAK